MKLNRKEYKNMDDVPSEGDSYEEDGSNGGSNSDDDNDDDNGDGSIDGSGEEGISDGEESGEGEGSESGEDSEYSDIGAGDSIQEVDSSNKEQVSSKLREYANTGVKHKLSRELHDDGSWEPSSKVAKVEKDNLYKPPTNEELNQLKETENLFHSSLFRMQITELLSEVSLRSKKKREIENAISELKSLLTSLEKGTKYELEDSSWLADLGVEVPFVMKPHQVKGSFQFVPPLDVTAGGSYLWDVCMKPHPTVDVLVVIPKSFYEAKDYLNQRYLRKRALYLAKLAAELSKSSLVEDAKFTSLHGNPLKPILVISVKVEGQRSVMMHLHLVPEGDIFKLHRFHPEKNNVRSHWFSGREDTENQPEKDVSTPFYNSAVLEDLTLDQRTEAIQKLLTGSQSIREGIMLLKVWLRQRELDKGYGGFSGYILTLFVCYLLSQNKLNTLMSSYQIFRNTLLKLSQSDWLETGITMCAETSDIHMPTLNDFHKHYDVVFVDPSGFFNLCYAMNRTIYKRVCYEATLGMKILDDRSVDNFEKLFMKKVPFTTVFDHLLICSMSSEQIQQTVSKFGLTDKLVDYGGSRVQICLSALSLLLEKALGQRAQLLHLLVPETASWDIEKKPASMASERLYCGLVLNAEFAFNVLDRGPSADSPEAQEFRRFWGSKSELRRFQDGGICEAVLWLNNANIAQKQLVCEHIVKYVLERHAAVKPESVQYIGGQLDNILHLPVVDRDKNSVLYGTGEEQEVSVVHVYDDLCKTLRRLSDLPLTINSIQGASPCFRFTEVFPPLPCTFRHRAVANMVDGMKRFIPGQELAKTFYIPTLQVICTLEGSGKWPDDYEAMRRLKMAFHIQLAEALKDKFNLPVKVGKGFIDVLKSHYVFRLVLAYTKEITMLKSIRSPDGKLLIRETEEATALEKETIALPRLTSTLHGLQQQYASYSTTTRLAKRWVSAHLLSDHVHPVAIELIVASLYLSPAPCQPPSSGLCGFQRFLELLSSFDWKTTPLLINLNNEFTVTDMAEISSVFSKDRSNLPLMFISTPLDKYSKHWTICGPSANILNRLVLLATRSLQVIQQQILDTVDITDCDLQQVFRPSLSMYDALIYLDEQQLPRRHESLDFASKYKILIGKSIQEDRFPVLNFDPAELLLKELRAIYGDLCLFFYDEYGGNVIGLLWKPSELQPKEFKVSNINYSKLHTTSTGRTESLSLIANTDAILEDIKIIGKGIVSRIDVKPTKT